MKYTIISAHGGGSIWQDPKNSLQPDDWHITLAGGQGLWMFDTRKGHVSLNKLEQFLQQQQVSYLRLDCDEPPFLSLSPNERPTLDKFLERTQRG